MKLSECRLLNRVCIILVLCCSHLVAASDIVYKPVSPTFGGNPLNGAFLLGQAQSQNEFASEAENSTTDRFEDRLENAILSQLARRVLDSAFGDMDDGLGEGGVFTSGDFEVEIITSNPDVIIVQITNLVSGEVTVIEVPVFGGG